MRTLLVLPLMCCTIIAATAAPAIGNRGAEHRESRLNAVQVREALLGQELTGVLVGRGVTWRECIGRDGRTMYWFAQRQHEGRVSIKPDGRACFSYDRDAYRTAHCFVVQRESNGQLTLQHETSPTRFLVTALRAVSSCSAHEAIS